MELDYQKTTEYHKRFEVRTVVYSCVRSNPIKLEYRLAVRITLIRNLASGLIILNRPKLLKETNTDLCDV